MSENVVNFKPAAVVIPAKKETALMISMIKRPPAKRLAEALAVQFPEVEIAVKDGGFTAMAILNGRPMMLCQQFNEKEDLRTGWWSLLDESFPHLVAYFSRVPAAPGPANDDMIEGVEAEADGG